MDEKIQVPLGETVPEEVQQKNVRLAQREITVMNNLDRIKEPINATIYLGENKVVYRNKAMEEMLLGMQANRKKFLLTFVKDTKQLLKGKKS